MVEGASLAVATAKTLIRAHPAEPGASG
jgi:hypothetical protein